MKKLYFVITIIFFNLPFYVKSQSCVRSCSEIESFTGYLETTGGYSNYNESMCFEVYGDWATITTGTNWNNWHYLQFLSEPGCTLNIQQSINMNIDKKVYLTTFANSFIEIDYISMNQSDTVFITGNNVDIHYLISNNTLDVHETINAIMLENDDSYVVANGNIYHVGDTILSANGTGNKVLVSSCMSNILPIVLLNFEVNKVGKLVQSRWSSSAEINSKGYYIEHSFDTKNWVEVGFVLSKGAASGYEFTHNTPFEGVNYYRLKMEDMDGLFSFSSTVSVMIDRDSKISVYPNPTKDIINVSGLSGVEMVSLYDVQGKLIKNIQIGDDDTINLCGIQHGLHFLKVSDEIFKISILP